MYSIMTFVLIVFCSGLAVDGTVRFLRVNKALSQAQTLLDVSIEQSKLIDQITARLGALIKVRSRNA